ncbi:hypothetical protein [Methylorubrum aminovorans]|uniref:hypothetical protein n=1 Tax=Methylorubrum aminovorans TaxID=269069 RepID=UPI001EE11E7B|nr:hypothetical protein [Methylorubrum aminovorans]
MTDCVGFPPEGAAIVATRRANVLAQADAVLAIKGPPTSSRRFAARRTAQSVRADDLPSKLISAPRHGMSALDSETGPLRQVGHRSN